MWARRLTELKNRIDGLGTLSIKAGESAPRAGLAAFRRFGPYLRRHRRTAIVVHMFPPVLGAAVAAARREGLPLRIPRISLRFVRSLAGPRDLLAVWKKLILLALIRISTARHGAEVPSPDRLCSIYDIVPLPGTVTPAHYLSLMQNTGYGVTELMVHPAYLTPELERLSAGSRMKDEERRALVLRPIAAEAAAMGIAVISYRDLSAPAHHGCGEASADNRPGGEGMTCG